jgi:hypothetical protein
MFLKTVEKIQMSLKSDKNNRYFTSRPIHIYHISLISSENETKFVEKMKTHIFFEYRTFYEKMWKNIVERGRSQMTIWRTCNACWILKATNTQRVCVILIAFPLQHRLHVHASMLSYIYIACLVIYKCISLVLLISVTSWFYCKNLSRCRVMWTSKRRLNVCILERS